MKNKARSYPGLGGAPFEPRTQPKSQFPALLDLRVRFAEAVAHHQGNRLDEAAQLYRKILQTEAKHYDSLHMLGIIHLQRGEYVEALRLFAAVLKDNPKFSPAHNNRGNALKGLKRFGDALASYDQAIAADCNNADALNNRGAVLFELKRFPEALASMDRAIALKPDHAQAFNNRGNVLKALKRFDEALSSCDEAIRLHPDFVDAFNNRGVILFEMQRFEEALESYRRALALKPDDAEIIKNRGNALARLRRYRDAVMDYDRASALDPAIRFLEGMRLHAKLSGCDWRNFEADCQHLKSSIASGFPASQPFTLLTIDSGPQLQLNCARQYVAEICAPVPPRLWRGERYAHQRIRVGYVSADFHEHPVAVLTAGLFEHHDKSRFETIAISIGPDTQDSMSGRLRAAFDRFCDAQAMSDADVAGLMRDLEIDIAVDLNGFTEGSRQNIFSFRPSPVQVNYLGYAGTLGANFWDYIIADRFVIPEKQRDCYAEKVVYLPETFMATDCRRRVSPIAPLRAEAGLPEKAVVFCNFGNSFKITPDLFDVWMRLLKQVEGSVLWLSASNPWSMQNLRAEAVNRGVAAERLVFAARVDRNEDHLARHRLADLFLDTLPYNAHASTSDALWADLPVLTCAGGNFASRVAGSLLKAVGLEELITDSLNDYEALALTLARDPTRLAAIKQTLIRNRETRPLFNTERFARHIGAAYTAMWERHRRGEAPESFAVAPHS